MKRDELSDLLAFLAVAEEGSFTRAAARIGTSQSALSHTLRRLEQSLNIKLLNRTTRSVTTTPAGDRLVRSLRPSFDEIAESLASLDELRASPAGTVRITTSQHAAETVLWPAILRLAKDYPDLKVEISVDQRLVDIAADRFDAGIRLGEQIARDMDALPIGPMLRMLIVASPAYLTERGSPQSPHDLLDHDCINLRMPTHGNLYAWEMEENGRQIEVEVEGRLVSDDIEFILQAAVDGMGLAFVMEDRAAPHIDAGALKAVVQDWCQPFAGYHLYFPKRKRQPAGLAALIRALEFRPEAP